MSQASDYLEAAVLDHVFGLASLTQAATLYLHLFSDDPGDASGGTELSGGSYAAVAITNDNTQWSRTGNVVTNLNEVVFPTATGGGQGTASHFVLTDALSGGNRYFHGALAASKTISVGRFIRFGAGKLTFTLNLKSTYLAGEMLDHLFGIDAGFTAPATMYLRAYTATPTDAGGGTEVSATGTAYAPISITNDNTQWSRTTNVVSNLNAQNYAVATASYGSVGWRALYDASSGGNLITWAPLTAPETIGIGDRLGFAVGDLFNSFD